MKGLNRAELIGRLGADPEMMFTQAGKPVTKFRIATDRTWKDDKGHNITETTWHKIVAWDKLAETCNQYLNKGDLVYVAGRIRNYEYDGVDGKKRYANEIVLVDMNFLQTKKSNGGTEVEADGVAVPAESAGQHQTLAQVGPNDTNPNF